MECVSCIDPHVGLRAVLIYGIVCALIAYFVIELGWGGDSR